MKEYESYIEGLEKEIDSRACLAIASAYSYLGKVDLAAKRIYQTILFHHPQIMKDNKCHLLMTDTYLYMLLILL